MRLNGTNDIRADKQKIWDALHDPDILKVTVPGARKVVRIDDTTYYAEGEIEGFDVKFNIRLTNRKPPDSLTIEFDGGAGRLANARGKINVNASQFGGSTRITYDADFKTGGWFAGTVEDIIRRDGQKMIDDFFSRVAQKVETPPALGPVNPPKGNAMTQDVTFSGSYDFKAAPADVWKTLFDTKVLSQVIPGNPKVELIQNAHLKLTFGQQLAPFFKGLSYTLHLSDFKPGQGVRVTAVTPKGKHYNFDLSLAASGKGTTLSWTHEAQFPANAPALAIAAIQQASSQIADRFFAGIAQAIPAAQPGSKPVNKPPAKRLAFG